MASPPLRGHTKQPTFSPATNPITKKAIEQHGRRSADGGMSSAPCRIIAGSKALAFRFSLAGALLAVFSSANSGQIGSDTMRPRTHTQLQAQGWAGS